MRSGPYRWLFLFFIKGIYLDAIKLIESKNYPGYFISAQKNTWMLMEGYDNVLKLSMPGNSKRSNRVSFRSLDNGWLCDNISDIGHVNNEDTESFENSTTFFLRQDKWFRGYVAFEPSIRPDYFLRHTGLVLKPVKFANTTNFKEDASWKIRDRGNICTLYQRSNDKIQNLNKSIRVLVQCKNIESFGPPQPREC